MVQNKGTLLLGDTGIRSVSVWDVLLWQSVSRRVAKEEGMYKYEFDVPEAWRNKHISLVLRLR